MLMQTSEAYLLRACLQQSAVCRLPKKTGKLLHDRVLRFVLQHYHQSAF
jgi:hypothetical protein